MKDKVLAVVASVVAFVKANPKQAAIALAAIVITLSILRFIAC